MAKRVQLIRHSTGGADAFTGLNGEITVDTTAKELRIHDSLTVGGIPTARKDLDNVANATVAIAGKMTAAQVVELTSATVAVAQEIVDRIADVAAEEVRALAAELILRNDGLTKPGALGRSSHNIGATTDLNSYFTGGFFTVDSAAPNNPTGWGVLMVMTRFAIAPIERVVQMLMADDNKEVWFRSYSASIWKPWIQFTTQGLLDAEEAARIAADIALKADILGTIYPVGSLYIGTSATNPSVILGVGTWTAFGQDRVMISAGASYPGSATGGSKDAVVVAHTHVIDPHFHNLRRRNHLIDSLAAGTAYDRNFDEADPEFAGRTDDRTATMQNAGVSGTNANLPPYIGVYMWKRTA